MLSRYIEKVLQQRPEYAGIVSVIEKEILHHDIMHVLVKQGALQQLTFIGGTALRLCYNSSRLSEDLYFKALFNMFCSMLLKCGSEKLTVSQLLKL